MPQDIGSTTIEFHRFGSEPGTLLKDNKYIRTCGYQRAAGEVVVRIEPRVLRRSLNQLRYGINRTAETELAAQQLLSGEAENFLPPSELFAEGRSQLHQVDIVTHASELRAYPFEAIYANASGAYLESPDKGVVLTRRIRSAFSYAVPPWPAVPSVLFVHAQVDHDLSQDLIDQHRRALCEALAPWGKPGELEQRKLLVVREVGSVKALVRARASAPFSYIHMLAHGARVAETDMEEYESEWGLRLGRADTAAAPPQAVADALKPVNELPLVVTLAACDNASADRPELGHTSLTESLHRSGIPVVVASQFPLTKPGSVTLTRTLYGRLLGGADVRAALHAARVALREEARQVDKGRHDWLSLVGYVRLPAEGYSRYLRAFGLRVQLHMLEAARKDAEPLLAKDAPAQDAFEQVAGRLGDRIKDLQAHSAALGEHHDRALQSECSGLLASASKSLAQLRFAQGGHFSRAKRRLEALSRTALDDAQKWYAQAYRQEPSQHWLGIQKLALEAALTGTVANPTELAFVRYVAQIASDAREDDYWACGTLAEAILLGALASQRFDLKGAGSALNALRERSAKAANDRGFAVKSTRRQFERYVNWWTRDNGYFPGRESDLSQHAQALLKCL